MQIHYLEIVSDDIDAICHSYSMVHGVRFGNPDSRLGNARIAQLPDGGMVGVRAPMHDTEQPVVRPYWLVEDIDAAISGFTEAGAEIAHPPLEIPGLGIFAIYSQGNIQHGLWQR